MSRGIGEHALIETLPDWLAFVFALVTQLGDVWFLAVLLLWLFWYAIPSREEIVVIGGAWFAGLGLYRGLKVLIAAPRPPSPPLEPTGFPVAIATVYELTAFASGYGFPSGHAVNATVVYVGLASVLTVSTARRRYAAAGGIVTAVCVARVVLGLHYVVDVVAGVGVGLAVLGLLRALVARRPADPVAIAFAFAIPLSLLYVAVSAAELEAVALLAASVVTFVAWRRRGADLVG